MGIEPTSAAWEAAILPLNHARSSLPYQTHRDFGKPVLERHFVGLWAGGAGAWLPSRNTFGRAFITKASRRAPNKSCYAVRLLCFSGGNSGGPLWPIRTCGNS